MTALVALLIGGAAIARMIWPGSLLGQILLFFRSVSGMARDASDM